MSPWTVDTRRFVHPDGGTVTRMESDDLPAGPDLAARLEHYARQFRAAGVDEAMLHEETDATTEEVIAWLEGRAPCPVDLGD